MTCGRAHLINRGQTRTGAAASHSAELVRGHLRPAGEGRLIRPCGAPSPQGEKGCRGSRWRPADFAIILIVTLSPVFCARGAAACPSESEGFARLATPETEIAYRWEPKDIKVGRFFQAEVVACRMPGQRAISGIVIDAQMPAHGHGMNYRPKAVQVGPDHFRFTGLMLHMAGSWRLTFDVIQGETRTRLSHELNLKP
jgi:hypothetical protein